MSSMKLVYTPRSHFSRKVRILLEAWQVEVELVDAGNVADQDLHAFAGNPMLSVPSLLDGDVAVYDSDHIAQYLVSSFAPDDEFAVLTRDVDLLNARAVMNGIMSAEVQVILAERTGIDTHRYERFDKIRSVIRHGLDWLEARGSLFEGAPSYAGFHLSAMWDHLKLYGVVPLTQSKLNDTAARIGKMPYVARTRPI